MGHLSMCPALKSQLARKIKKTEKGRGVINEKRLPFSTECIDSKAVKRLCATLIRVIFL